MRQWIMVKINKYKERIKIYQRKMYSLLENIISQPWGGFISKEEKKYIALSDKLQNLDITKYNLMAKMYNETSDIREQAWLTQLVWEKQENIKRLKSLRYIKNDSE